MSDDGDRARLEAIVFGRDAAVSDAERETAAVELVRVLEEERAREAEAQAAVREVAEAPAAAAELREDSAESPSEDPPREHVKPRWRRLLIMAGIAIAVVVVAGVAAPALMSGRPLFGSSDSMAIFDRPQTEQDLNYPSDIYWDVIPDSVRFVGSKSGFDVYVLQAGSPETEISPASDTTMYCMIVGDGPAVVDQPCRTPEEFSSGMSSRFNTAGGGWTEVAWDIRTGVRVTSGTHPPIPSPLAVFDEDQDDADLNALVYLPDIPPSQQDTVRFLNSSAGYFAAAYRDAVDAVCLAVYAGGTTIATSESVCVTEAAFEAEGVQLLYPAAAPEISVTWGPTGVAFGGR